MQVKKDNVLSFVPLFPYINKIKGAKWILLETLC